MFCIYVTMVSLNDTYFASPTIIFRTQTSGELGRLSVLSRAKIITIIDSSIS